jgi:hypothetical protein
MNDERQLWQVGAFTCVMITCCAGAELQVRRREPNAGETVLVRELYPMKSDLYDRARTLEGEYRALDRAQETAASTG